MRRRRLIPVPISARLMIGLLLAVSSAPLGAQQVSESHIERGFGPVYDAAHETTLTGTIQDVVTEHAAGSPAGMHLLVAGPDGVVDTHVGPFLSKQTIEALQAGTPVQIVGAMSSIRGKDYLLARQLSVAGRTITVRSERGILVHEHSPRAAHASQDKSDKTAQKESAL